MKLRLKVVFVMSLVVVVAAVLFFTSSYKTQRKTITRGIDEKLYAATLFAAEVLPEDYHSSIQDENSVSDAEYLKVVDKWNQICVKLGLEYIWSLLKVDGRIVFTSGSSTSKDVSKGDHALFFDEHTNPDAYEKVFRTMKPDFHDIVDKWGSMRAVLVPFRDSHGRVYLFGASMKIAQINALIKKTLWRSLVFSIVILVLGILLSIFLTNSLARSLEALINMANRIAEGELDLKIEESGLMEVKLLAHSINEMNQSIQEKIEKIKESEEQYRSLVRNIPGITYRCRCDEHWTMEFVSDEIEKVTLYPASDFIEHSVRSFLSIIHKEDQQRVGDIITRAVENKEFFILEYRIVTADGNIRWVLEHGQCVANEQGEALFLDGVIIDITERKEAEEQVRFLSSITEYSTDSILVADCTFSTTYVNDAFVKLFGYSQNEMIGKNPGILNVEPLSEIIQQKIEKTVSSGQEYLGGALNRRKDGSTFDCEYKIMPLIDQSGQIYSYLGVQRDITDRKEAEEELSETKALFQAAMDNSPAGIAIAEAPSGKLIYVNKEGLRIPGGSEDGLVEDVDINKYVSSWKVMHFDGAAYKAEEVPLARAIMYGETCSKEFVLRRPGGEDRIVWANAAPILDDDGNVKFGIVVFLDVTDRKKAAEEYRKLAEVVKHSGELINIATPDGKMIFLNNAGKKMLGIDDQEIENKRILDVISEPYVHLVKDDILPALMKGDSWEGDLQYKNLKTGKLTDVHAMTFSIGDPKKQESMLIANVSRDITGHKKSEELLRESEERFRTIMKQFPEAMEIYDSQGNLLEVNDGWESFWNLKKSDVEGCFNIINDKECIRTGLTGGYKKALQGETVLIPPTEYNPEDMTDPLTGGLTRWIQSKIYPLIIKDGIIKNVVLCMEDITARKQAEEELDKYRQGLEELVEQRTKELKNSQKQLLQSEKLASLGQLSAGIAHELNSPLTGLISLLRSYKKEKNPDSDEYKDLSDMETASEYMAKIVKDINTFSRTPREDVSEVNCNKIIDSTMSLCAFIFKKKEITINKDYEEALHSIEGDKNQLQQVFLNILTNACDSMDVNGTLEVKTRNIVNEEGPAVEVSFEDNGLGISEGDIDRVFDPFFTTKRPGKGVGLGLSIAFNIVKNHNGTIIAESVHGKGTKMAVAIPVKK